ncbi:hypothetical protein T12_13404 [Trichinella patagoniensis]|uniref:Uncharacterized protein n=2 Tax=Trichinella TaxID=6333 RepID=A0A0V1A9U7_9BILA|nr:hypothetical protein T12_13404 [Trichinella patagoniensis]KRY32660.1 hypothetical protein T01_2504 [Trichinella spiralis]
MIYLKKIDPIAKFVSQSVKFIIIARLLFSNRLQPRREENLLQLTTLEKENKKDGRWLNTAYFSFKINQTSGRQCQAKSSRLHKLAKRYVKIYLSPAINRRDDKSAN